MSLYRSSYKAVIGVCFSCLLSQVQPNLDHFVVPLPDGYDNVMTAVSQNGVRKAALTFFGAFPSNGNLFYRLQLVRPALDYALTMIQNRTFRFDRFEFQYIGTNELADCHSLDNIIVYKTIEAVTSLRMLSEMVTGAEVVTPVGYFGPGCSKGVHEMAIWLNGKNLS